MIPGTFQNIQQWAIRYERHISAAGLAIGFVVDTLTFQRIDFLFGNIVLFAYLVIAAGSITLINLHGAEKLHAPVIARLAPFFPFFTQYAFGGLLSAFAIFYTKSATLSTSWPFLLFIAALLIGNERFRSRYQKFGFQITVFFVVLFTFLIFYIPLLLGRIGTDIFLLSGAISIGLIVLFVSILFRVAPMRVKEARRFAVRGVGGAFIAINLMYFGNIIPPIPLALKDAGVYHAVVRLPDGTYRTLGEKTDWKDTVRGYEDIAILPGDPVFVYSAIFAPTKLNATVRHIWQYYDEENREWLTATEVSFPISGGREKGYRGYSVKGAVFPGLWRVEVVTSYGAVIGRVKFVLSYTRVQLPLHENVK